MNQQLLNYLGKLGSTVPVLTNTEWKTIFEFINYFLTVKEERAQEIDIKWGQMKDILVLLGKVRES